MGPDGMKSTRVIGSIKNRQISYLPEHTFFDKDIHSMPKATMVKSIVNEEIDRDYLGTKPPRWNGSVSLSDKIGIQDG